MRGGSKTLLDNVGLLADAPGGIALLRELVLELALAGQLTHRVPTDEPASQLIKRIRRQLPTGDRPALPHPTASTDEGEPRRAIASLPQGWEWSCVGELGIVGPRNLAASETEVGFVPMPLIDTDIRRPPSFEVRTWGDVSRGFTHVADGDVAVAKITPCFQNGKTAVFSGLPSGLGAATTELFVLRPTPDGVDPRYVQIFLRSRRFISGGVPLMTGTAGQQRLPRDYFATAELPLPPLEEQTRIVACVDDLLGLCDELEQRRTARDQFRHQWREVSYRRLAAAEDPDDVHRGWQRLSDNWSLATAEEPDVGALRRTILGLAIRGHLARQDESEPTPDSTADWWRDLDRLRLWTLPGTGKTPAGWTRRPLGSVGSWGSGGTPAKSHQEYYGGTVPWVVIGDLNDGLVTKTAARITELGLANSSAKIVSPGTVFIAMYGASIGKTGVAGVECATNQAIAHCTPDPSVVTTEYLFALARAIKTTLIDAGKGAAQPNISQTMLKHLVIALPPLREQVRITSRLADLMALCDELETAMRAQDAAVRPLAQALARGSVQ